MSIFWVKLSAYLEKIFYKLKNATFICSVFYRLFKKFFAQLLMSFYVTAYTAINILKS